MYSHNNKTVSRIWLMFKAHVIFSWSSLNQPWHHLTYASLSRSQTFVLPFFVTPHIHPNILISATRCLIGMCISVLHGPGLGPRAGPARSPWAGPGRAWIIFCGPGRVRAWNLKARAGPGPVNINFAGRGPGLGLTFPGLGRARACSESHYYFNIMIKDYLHLSIAKDHCFLCCKCNCTMQCISMASRQACQPIYYPFNTQQWSSTAELQEST